MRIVTSVPASSAPVDGEGGLSPKGLVGSGSAQSGSVSTGSDKLRNGLAALEGISLDQLRAEWRLVHRTPAPGRLSRDLLVRGIAYKLQEAALGGLSPSTRRKLTGDSDGRMNKPPTPETKQLRPGTMLVREWHGRGHTVLVQERGFELEGRHYASLTEVARHITGARWSGPRFFGLNRPIRSSSEVGPQGGCESVTDEGVAVGPGAAASEPAHA